jgi:hypothetical protein
MPKLVAAVKLITALIGAIKVTASFKLIATVALVGFSLLSKPGRQRRDALAATLQTGEVARQGVFGRAAVAGSLVDAFNFGGKYGTDWEVLVIALADHRCDALEGFFVDDAFHTFTGDGAVPGFNGQLEVYFRDGRWDQEVPSILTTHGPGWTENDRGRGVAWAVVAYKADDEKAKTPVWEGRRPSFLFVLRGLRAYQARKDSSVGGSGAHRWNNPATREWTENPIDIRHTWVRGIYAGDRVNQPEMLLLGRGLSAIEAPPQNVFARANLCDELVDGAPRYRIGGVVSADEPFIEVESDFAAACGGVISQPEGAVEVDPGEARAPVAHFTDRDLIVGSRVSWSEFLGISDDGWVNTVIARFVDPVQRWKTRGAPVRRDTADIVTDGGPREQTLNLTLVTNVRQAERLAEIARRLGRLWARGRVTLPPRFAGIEEGDWVTWQSDRYFKGSTRTFLVEAWGSDEGWRHQLTLRQISASVFSETAPLDDGVIAAQQPAPAALQPPIAGAWALSATTIAAGGVRVPALQIVGQTDDPAARFVIFEFVQQSAAPDDNTAWTLAGASRPDVTRLSIPVPSGGTHYAAVSYVVDGVTGPRRVLGPVTLAEFAYPNGVSIADLQPAEFGSNRTQTANANRVPFSRMEGGFGWAVLGGTMASFTPIIPFEFQGRPFIQCDATAGAAGQTGLIGSAPFAVIGGERLSISSRIDAFSISGPAPQSWALFIEYRQGNTFLSNDLIASGTGAAPSALTVRQEDFSTVPLNANNAYLVLSVTAAGAGVIRMAFLEPMVTSAIDGQAIHPPFSPGPNAFDAADVTSQNTAAFINGQSPWATWAGLTPAVLEAELATARADATASLADLTAIASDAVLDRGEKPAVRERRANIMAEFPIWRDRAVDFGVAVGLRNSYTTSYNELIAYLTAINLDANTNSPIVRADFIAAFVNYATQRELVIEAISQIAAQRALWAGVTGSGRPEDNADVTAGKTAAFINAQSPWATWTGLTPAVLEAELATARADATASLADLTAIASDGVVTRGEKISVRERRTNIMAEFPIWRDRAADFGVDTAIRSNYQAAYDALIAYLTAINIDANTNSNVVRADFVAGFNNYAIWRELVIEAISQIASQRALWAGVTGTGRPEDNADVTAGKTAAFINAQSPWATSTIPVGKLAQPRANVFPYPFGPTDGRTPAQIGWANTSGGGGSLISFTSIPLDGVVYQYGRISGGSSFSVFPSFAMAYGAGLQTSVSLNGFGNGASLVPSVDCLNAAQDTILANHPLIYNPQSDRWEANGLTTPAGTAFLRIVTGCIFPASGSFQEVVFWAIKVERGPNATPFMDSSLPRMFGNQVEYDNGSDLNALRPAEFGSDKTTNQPVVGLLNPVTGRATSRRITSQIVAGGVLQTLNTNPLTASTDSSTGVSTITINAHSVFDDFGQLDFTASSIGGLSSNTLYYVWETNPDFVGGARSYVATTDRNQLTVAGRRYVGFVTTPATGSGPNNGGGGGGAGFPGLNPELAP